MIDPKELRIGNWVEFDFPEIDKYDQIEALYIGMCGAKHHESWDYERISPIPLTPEILIACGFMDCEDPAFDKYADAKMFYKSKIQVGIRPPEDAHIVKVVWFMAGYVQSPHFKSLHQLQNLYFALTGEELNYKPLKQ